MCSDVQDVGLRRIGEWEVGLSEESKPEGLMIEVTTRCNYECSHCFRREMREGFRDMELDVFYGVIEQAREIGLRYITLSGWGEPLVHPEIGEIVSKCKESGFKLTINTNGSLLGDHVDLLVRSEVERVVVSVDSAEPELHRELRGGKLGDITEALIELKELKLRKGARFPMVYLQLTLSERNLEGIEKVVDYAMEVGAARVVISNVIPLSSSQKKIEPPEGGRVEEVREKISKRGSWIDLGVSFPSLKPSVERKCPFILNRFAYIRSDGRVSPCLYYAHKWKNSLLGVEREIRAICFGKLPEDGLLEIWRSPSYSSFRCRTYFLQLPSCLDCNLAPYCSYTKSNEMDCWGNSPTCAHCPFLHGLASCPL